MVAQELNSSTETSITEIENRITNQIRNAERLKANCKSNINSTSRVKNRQVINKQRLSGSQKVNHLGQSCLLRHFYILEYYIYSEK